MSDDRGSITLVAAGCLCAFLALVFLVLTIVDHMISQHRAQVAADMAAVSAVHAGLYGHDPCRQASQVAQANQTTLVECAVEQLTAVITVEFRGAQAQARAGVQWPALAD